jgi:transcriptional regulator with XRE-family HTH domain
MNILYKQTLTDTTISDRFLHLLRVKKVSQKEFEDLSGIPQPTLSRFITGKVRSPKVELITALVQYFPELNLRWLLIGEGEMFHAANDVTIEQLSKDLENIKLENENLRKELMEAKDRIIGLLSE